jgi:hypothetical protein
MIKNNQEGRHSPYAVQVMKPYFFIIQSCSPRTDHCYPLAVYLFKAACIISVIVFRISYSYSQLG